MVSPPPLGLSVLQRAARDPPVAKLSPHQIHNSSPVYVSAALHSVFTMHSEWVINANTPLAITPKLLGYWSRGSWASKLYWFSKGAVRLLSRVGQTRVVANLNLTQCTNLNATEIQCGNLWAGPMCADSEVQLWQVGKIINNLLRPHSLPHHYHCYLSATELLSTCNWTNPLPGGRGGN